MPFFARVLFLYFATVVAATYSRRDVRPAERALAHAREFFKKGWHSFKRDYVPSEGDEISEPTPWPLFWKEVLWAVIFWSLIFGPIVYSIVKAGRQSDVTNSAALREARQVIQSERAARVAAEEATKESKAAQIEAEHQLQEAQARLKDVMSAPKEAVRADEPNPLDLTVRELKARLESEKAAHQDAETRAARESAMRIQADKQTDDLRMQLKSATNMASALDPNGSSSGGTLANSDQVNPTPHMQKPPIPEDNMPVKKRTQTYRFDGRNGDNSLNVHVSSSAKSTTTYVIFDGTTGIEIVGDPERNGEEEWVRIRAGKVTGWVRQYLLHKETD